MQSSNVHHNNNGNNHHPNKTTSCPLNSTNRPPIKTPTKNHLPNSTNSSSTNLSKEAETIANVEEDVEVEVDEVEADEETTAKTHKGTKEEGTNSTPDKEAIARRETTSSRAEVFTATTRKR